MLHQIIKSPKAYKNNNATVEYKLIMYCCDLLINLTRSNTTVDLDQIKIQDA